MNNTDFQLIHQEQIFDLTTQQLQQQLIKIQNYLTRQVPPQHKLKVEQTKQLIEQQINERQLLHQFQKLCSKYDSRDQKENKEIVGENKEFIQKLDSFNTQFQQLVNQIEKGEELKLSLPPEEKKIESEKGEDQKRATNSSLRFSKIKKEGNENIKSKEKDKQKETQKQKQKEKEAKVIVKPKSVVKSGRIQVKPDSNANEPKVQTNTKKEKQTKLGTRTSIESDKISVVSESKPLKLVSTKKPAKKVSKKQANDWLVQLVRQEEEKRQKQKQKSNNRSSLLMQNKLEQKQIKDQSQTNKKQQASQLQLEKKQQKEASNYQSIQTSQGSIFTKQDIHIQNVQGKVERQAKANNQQPKQISSISKIEQTQIKKQTKIDKIKQQIFSLKQQQSKMQQQKQILQEQKINSSTKEQKSVKQTKKASSIVKIQTVPSNKQLPASEIPQPIINVQIAQNQTKNIEQQDINHNVQLPAEPQSLFPKPIHQLDQYNFKLASTTQFKIQKIQQSQNQSNESDQQKNRIQQLFKTKQRQSSSKLLNKACYSQEYWQRVRKQALTNLERVKLMKQLRQNQKQHLLNQIQLADLSTESQQISTNTQSLSNTNTQFNMKRKINDDQSNQQHLLKQELPISTPSKQPPSKLTIKKNPEKKKLAVSKKPQPIPIKLPQIIPNYLDQFPTFNHIFSVYYNKPHNQAVLDIQTLMKQLVPINSNHLSSITNNPTYRRPMFRSFDNTCMYVNDAHQLLLHAQTTNIDLKTLLNRLNVFNENLHGRFEQKPEEVLYYRVVKSREEVYDIITTAFLRTTKWQELPHGMNLKTSWNLLWSWAKPEVDFNKLLVFQKVNHFPHNKNLSRKDLLYKNLDNFKKITKASIGFVPLTFNLPKQYSAFSTKFHQDQSLEGAMNIWIMKPIGKSRGRGIKLINNLSDLNYLDSIVVQKYLKNPLLLDGYKFDLRVYVLVTSLHPLEVFVYKQGFARLSTQKYVLDPHSIKNTFIHLTNFSIQRNNKEAQNVTNDGGSKITFKVLRQKLEQQNIKWSTIWDKIHQIIIKSLLACSLSMPASPSAFQLFGYDVIIDTDSNVHLIEINASPSLERSYLIDQIIKQSLIDDIMDLVDFPNFNRAQCINVMNQRLQRKSNAPYNSIEDNIDIGRILKWKPLRKIGEMPAKMGLFERVAPEEKSSSLERLVSTKYNPNIRYADVWN